jgi:stearoyl-CoA desaturase (Delta-9 desaturase)
MTLSQITPHAKKQVISATHFAASQRVHFLIFDALPIALLLILPLLVPVSQALWQSWLIAATMWFIVGGVGISVGFHRHFSHRSFTATPAVRLILGIAGCMAAQGSVIYWVALHRMHHTYSDQPGDPHSPHASANGKNHFLTAFAQGHMGWSLRHDVPKPSRYAKELLADPIAQWVSKYYYAWIFLGLAIPTCAGWLWLSNQIGSMNALLAGLFWGGIFRLAVGHHIIWAINSLCHCVGSRPHTTNDQSTNIACLSVISFGESWHNNHHRDPTSAKFGSHWKQPDIGWWVICLITKMGLARPRTPTGDSISR